MKTPLQKDPTIFLKHIKDAITKIERYSSGGKAKFFGNTMAQDAVIRNLEIIGEATRHIPESYRKEHAEIPWRSITALRNVLIHEYFGVDMEQVWGVVRNRIPMLKRNVLELLGEK